MNRRPDHSRNGGHRHGFPWARWDWYLVAHYPDEGAAACANALSDLSGEDCTKRAVSGRAHKLGLKLKPEVHKRLSVEHAPRRASGARLSPGRVIVRDTHNTKLRIFCPACFEWNIVPGEATCPRGHRRLRGFVPVEV